MDLRPLALSTEQAERTLTVLNYQPFVIIDNLQTGVGYSSIGNFKLVSLGGL